MPRLRVGNADLYFEVHGQGPTIVLAHGVGGNHASWYQQVDAFARAYQVITIDQRGFGLSTDPDRRGRSAFIEDLTALLDHCRLEHVALVGQSMGGGTVAGFTCTYPARVRALVLADTLAALGESGPVKARMDQVRAATGHLSQAERVLGPRIRADHPELALLYGQIASFNAYSIKTVTGEPRRWTTEELAATEVPVLFVVGMDDALFPADIVRAVQAQVPNSFLVELADTGHSAYFENPRAFNDNVLSFLRKVGFPGSGADPERRRERPEGGDYA
jgi:3-oxoadipate enol-lactonase